MIRTLLATTALATLVATGAYAQDATAPAPATPAPATENATPAAPVERADGSLVTNIIGESVYNGTGDNAEDIGKVSDIVFDKDGQAKSAIIGVGGFLGVGEKKVAYDFAKLQWAEQNGDRWLVANNVTKDELNGLPEFDSTPYEPAAPQAASNDGTAAPAGTTAPATDSTMAPADNTASNNTTTMAPADTAQNAPADTNDAAAQVKPAEGMLATNIVGENVYNGTGDDAQNIGDVNDIVLDKGGKAEQLVIGVGGFLGVGEKSVAYDYDKASWAEKDGDSWLVVETTKEDLQKQPDFDRKAYDPAPATTASNAAPETTPMAAAPADNNPAPAPSTDTAENATPPADDNATKPADTAQNTPPADDNAATTPAPSTNTAENTAPADNNAATADQTKTGAIDKSTLTEMPVADISAENLIGTTVYGANDENIGEIGDVVLSTDKKVDAIVIDVGGFLGIGEKPVAVGMDNLKFMTDKDGNRYLYTNFTKDQLEAQVAYDKSTYAENRDKQRMIMNQ